MPTRTSGVGSAVVVVAFSLSRGSRVRRSPDLAEHPRRKLVNTRLPGGTRTPETPLPPWWTARERPGRPVSRPAPRVGRSQPELPQYRRRRRIAWAYPRTESQVKGLWACRVGRTHALCSNDGATLRVFPPRLTSPAAGTIKTGPVSHNVVDHSNERGELPLSRFDFGGPVTRSATATRQPARVALRGDPPRRGPDRKLSLPDRARAPPEVSRSRPVPSCPRFPTARQRVPTTRHGVPTVIGPPWSGPATLGTPPPR